MKNFRNICNLKKFSSSDLIRNSKSYWGSKITRAKLINMPFTDRWTQKSAKKKFKIQIFFLKMFIWNGPADKGQIFVNKLSRRLIDQKITLLTFCTILPKECIFTICKKMLISKSEPKIYILCNFRSFFCKNTKFKLSHSKMVIK